MQVTLNTRLSPETALALDRAAAETGQSKASIVEAALKAYLKGGEIGQPGQQGRKGIKK
jgi:predicted transcriptional regulator